MLCAKLASALNLQVTNILTDNQVLGDAATSSSMLRTSEPRPLVPQTNPCGTN